MLICWLIIQNLKLLISFFQSSGIFSEGLADLSTKKYSTRSGGGGSYRERDCSGGSKETAATLEKPKLSVITKIDKTDEAEKLKALLNDKFIEDGSEIEVDWTKQPVSLPLGKKSIIILIKPLITKLFCHLLFCQMSSYISERSFFKMGINNFLD